MLQKSDRSMRLCLVLLTLNLAFIWENSLLPASASAAFSSWVQDLLSHLLGTDGGESGAGHGLLRKLAHFSEFLSLGLLLSWLFAMLKKKFRLPLLCGFLAACVDESIQLFVPGRGPSLWDVSIDTSGCLLGVGLFLLGLNIQKNYFKRKQMEDKSL